MRAGPYIGVLLAVASAFCYAAMNITVKMSAPWVTAWQSGAGRFAFGLLVLPLLVTLIRSNLSMRDWGWLFIRSLFGASAFVLLVFAFRTAPISQAVVLFYINPAASALMAPLIVGDRTPPGHWPLILGSLAGVALILTPFAQEVDLVAGHFLALASGLCASLTIISTRRVIRSNTSWAIYFHVCTVGLIGCLIPMFIDHGPYAPATWQGWLGVAATGLTALLAQVTMNASLAHLKAHHAGVILSLEVIIISAFGVLVLGDPVTWSLVVGAVLILGCGLGLNLGRAASPKQLPKGR